MTTNEAIWRLFAAAVMAFMLSPLLILVVFCFSENRLLGLPVTGLTFDWVVAVTQRPEFWSSLYNSLIITGVVGTVSTIVGTMAALGMARMRPAISVGLMVALTVPVMLPPLMLGVALLSYYSSLDIRLGLHTVILSHLVFSQPFVILIVAARMASFDYATIDSARDLGALPLRTFFTVILPIIAPSVVGAALIAMALSLDDFLVTYFTIGGGNTLPIFMWGMLRRGVDPTINVVAATLMLLSVGVSVVGLRFARYRG